MKAVAFLIGSALLLADCSQVIAEQRRVAFFGFQLINTSLQLTTPEEGRRIRLLDNLFRQKLSASGRSQLIPIPPDLDDVIEAAPIANCNGCERDFALRVGADLAAWGTVQKVS
jgi:Protein of unknown function (DUF2380)